MRKIFKYILNNYSTICQGNTILKMPNNAIIIKCNYQRCIDDWNTVNLCMWAIIDPDKELISRAFMVIATGDRIPVKCEYITTVTSDNGQFISHVFEYHE